jgi:hypothetical protein
MRSSSQTDEEALLRSWVMVDFISAFRRLAVSIASERQMELLYSEYTSSTDTSLSHSLNVMPPVLKTFLFWLLDDVAYDTINKDHTIPPEKLRKHKQMKKHR